MVTFLYLDQMLVSCQSSLEPHGGCLHNLYGNALFDLSVCFTQADIAKYEEERAPFYAWLQLAPLTEGQLLQRVLLPNFEAVPQKAVLDRILRAGAWRSDASLTTALTTISFVLRGRSLHMCAVSLHVR